MTGEPVTPSVGVLMTPDSPYQRDIARRLAQAGARVHTLVVSDRSGYLRSDQAAHRRSMEDLRQIVTSVDILPATWPGRIGYLLLGPIVRRIAAVRGISVLFALYGGGLAAAAYASGVRPFAVYVVGSDVLGARGLVAAVTRHVLRGAGKVFVNGRYLSQRAHALAPGARLYPLYHGVDLDRFRPGDRTGGEIRVICTRGFLPVYNNAYLIEALAATEGPIRDLRITFAGPGPLLGSARSLADQLLSAEMRGRIEFLGGVDHARMPDLLGAHDMYVCLSRSDGTSTSLLEAMACGLYPVVSDIPQHREWVDEKKANGALVPLDDPQAAARVLERALRDRSAWEHAGPVNRELVKERANGAVAARTMLAELAKLSASRA